MLPRISWYISCFIGKKKPLKAPKKEAKELDEVCYVGCIEHMENSHVFTLPLNRMTKLVFRSKKKNKRP